MRAGPKGAVTADPLSFRGVAGVACEASGAVHRRVPDHAARVGCGGAVQAAAVSAGDHPGAFAPGIRTALVQHPAGERQDDVGGRAGDGGDVRRRPVRRGVGRRRPISVRRTSRCGMRRRMVELNPVLAERVHVYADRLYLPENDAMLLPLPAEPGALHGHDPSLLVVDELHVVTEAVWEAVTSVTGKRPQSLTLAISTPASSPDSIMWRLVEHGRAGDPIRRSTSRSSRPPRAARSTTVRRGVSGIRRWRAVIRSWPRTASRLPVRRSANRCFRQLRSRAVGDRGRVVAAVGCVGSMPVRSCGATRGAGRAGVRRVRVR